MPAATKTEEERERAPAAYLLGHPLRVRILEVLNEKDMSPSTFQESGLAEDRPSLSVVAHHFRVLEKYNCLKVVREDPVRGALEKTYRGAARAYFTDVEWGELSDSQRRRISKVMLQGMMARADGAIAADTFDLRLDRHLTWIAMDLDEQGWGEFTTELAECFGRVQQIRHDAATRLKEAPEIPVHTTFGMLGFESPRTVDVHGAELEQ